MDCFIDSSPPRVTGEKSRSGNQRKASRRWFPANRLLFAVDRLFLLGQRPPLAPTSRGEGEIALRATVSSSHKFHKLLYIAKSTLLMKGLTTLVISMSTNLNV